MEMREGTYFIGDPCYVLGDPQERWEKYLDEYGFKTKGDVGTFEGHNVFAAGTAHGDGVFFGSDGVKYGVDAGLIGATPIELWEENYEMQYLRRLGCIVLFTKPFEAHATNGHFVIGDIEIETEVRTHVFLTF